MKKIFKMAAFMLALGSMTAGFTSCGEETDEDGNVVTPTLEEKIDFSGLKAVAKADGMIEIEGIVKAQGKIKSLELQTPDGTVIVDLLKVGDQEKVKAINEAGEKEKSFELAIPTTPVAVQKMKLVGKTRGDKKAESAQIGEDLSTTIGSSKNTEIGSYLSLKENTVYKLADAKNNQSKIDVIAASSEDGYDVVGIRRASEAKDANVSAGAGKTALFDADGKSIADGTSVLAGTIITASECIATFKVEPESNGSAKITGVIIKNSTTLPLDVTAFHFSK